MHDPEDPKKHNVDYRRSFGLDGSHDEGRPSGGKKTDYKKKNIEVKQEPMTAKARRTGNRSLGIMNHAPASDVKLTEEKNDSVPDDEFMKEINLNEKPLMLNTEESFNMEIPSPLRPVATPQNSPMKAKSPPGKKARNLRTDQAITPTQLWLSQSEESQGEQ